MLLSLLCLNQFCSRASAFYDSVTIQKLFLMPVCALIRHFMKVLICCNCVEKSLTKASYYQAVQLSCPFLQHLNAHDLLYDGANGYRMANQAGKLLLLSILSDSMIYFPVITLMSVRIGANREVMVVGHMWSSSCYSTVIVFSSYHQGFVCQFLYSD